MKDILISPFSIGCVRLANKLVLAPIAGTTTAPFRSLCQYFGAGLTVSELTSAAGLVYDTDFQKNHRYLAMAADPSADAIQLFGSVPEHMGDAVRRLIAHPVYGQYSLIDINMGCPAPKVMKTGAGAALMGNQERAAELVRYAVDAACDKPVTVKIRSGLDQAHINAPSFAKAMQTAGAAAVAVHARTAKQRYAGKADYDVIARVRDVLTVPLIGNGDLASMADIERMHRQTGVDAFMVGRAAIGNLWLFNDLLTGQITSDLKKAETLIALVTGLVDLLGEKTALVEVRPQLGAAVRGRPDAAVWRKQLFEAKTLFTLFSVINACFGCANCTMPL